MKSPNLFRPLLAAFLLGAAIEPGAAVAQTIRSTRFDGTRDARVLHLRHPRYDATVPMTVEAWIYRENASRGETIVSHDRRDSWSLGLAPRLRFYRGGGLFAESDRAVAAGKWTHLAASYDGTNVHFYLNANSAGTVPLAHAGAGTDHGVSIGADPSDSLGFLGYIDEVRIWNRARTQAEIGATMYEEVRVAEGLAAVFPTAGGPVYLPGAEGIIAAGVVAGGAESSVFGILPRDLLVPRAARAERMAMDGAVDPTAEYLGAEMLAIPYPVADPTVRDAVAYLVHTTTDLHIGVTGLWGPPPGDDPENYWLSLLLDPQFTRASVPQLEHVRLNASLDHGVPSRWWNGDGAGDYEPCVFMSEFGPISCEPAESTERGVRWQVAKGSASEFFAVSLEFRIAKEMLGEWTEIDGLALIHSRLGGALKYPGPVGARGDSPRTWARVAYTESTGAVPIADVFGFVKDVTFGGEEPVAGHRVFINFGGSFDLRETDSGGFFRFQVPVAPGTPFTLQVDTCSSCRYYLPNVSSTGIQPTSQSELALEYPGCPDGICVYAPVVFQILQPPPGIRADSIDPVRVPAAALLRESPRKFVERAIVTVRGANLHREIQVHLQPQSCPEVPPLSDCEDAVVPVQVARWSADGSSIGIRMPEVASFAPGEGWKVAVHDLWFRDGFREWVAAPALVRHDEPAYPLIHGFGFDNGGFPPLFRHLLATFGRNAYFCAGIPGRDGRCIGCLVPRPSYLLYHYVFTPWIAASGGSCVGMASTSLLLASGDLVSEDFDPLVHFAGGFTSRGSSRFDIDVCGTVDPLTLAAVVETNHGVQTSAEYIFEVIHQATSSTHFADGDPRRVLADVREHLRERILCMRDGGGHCVTPYAVEDLDATTSRIWVYDNNFPCEGRIFSAADTRIVSAGDGCVTGRFVDIDLARNRFAFLHGFHDDGTPDNWDGTRIYSMPLSLFREERHAPFDPRVLATLPVEIYRLLVSGVVLFAFGSAHGLYTTPAGERWGWKSDGTFVEEMSGAVPLAPMTGAPGETPPMPVFLSDPPRVLDVELSGRGGDYGLFATRGGHLAALQVLDSRAGDADTAHLESDGEGRLEALRYSSSRGGTRLLPAFGVAFDEREEAVFRWSGIAVGAGGEAGFRLLRETRGVEFHNRTGSSSRHTVTVEFAVDGTGIAGLSVFGPFEAPHGATHRVTILNWPESTKVRSELDLNGDGVFDQSTTTGARTCSLPSEGFEDCNRNGIADSCDLQLGIAEDRNVNRVPDECDPKPARFRLAVEETELATCGRASIDLEAPEPVDGFQLGLEWDPLGPVQVVGIVPGRSIPEDEIEALFVDIGGNRGRNPPGKATVGLLFTPGVRIGPAADLEVLEVLLETAGALPETTATLCIADGTGDPPINTVVSVTRGANIVSVRPELVCGTVKVTGLDDPPEIFCPGDMEVEGDASGAVVHWEVRAEVGCGEVTVPCNPPSGSLFPVGTTEVICTAVDASGTTAECRFQVTVKPRSPVFKRADANADRSVDITDPVQVLGYLFLGGAEPACLDAADANDDNAVDISDASAILGYLFLGGDPPPAPGPFACGPDPTASGLAGCVYGGCK